MSGVSRGCYKETAPVEFQLNTQLTPLLPYVNVTYMTMSAGSEGVNDVRAVRARRREVA